MSTHRPRHRSAVAMVAFCVLSVAALGGVVAFRLAAHPPGVAPGSTGHRSLAAQPMDTGTPPELPTMPATTPPPPPLRQGSSGPAVAQLQHRLAALGYQSRKQTGTFDTETTHAVVAFEKVNGLPLDGVAGPAVIATLDHPAVPTPRHHRSGLDVEVDLARQVAVVYTDGAVTRIYDVCTGKPSTPTPPGEFTVKYKIDGMHHAPLGPMWRPVYFNYDGFAFHGAEPVLTTPSSHGCVRMTDPAMNELFGMLTKGVPVSIF